MSRSYTDTGDGLFTYDTFVLAKIGDAGAFTDASTFTISNYSASVVPEPASAALLLLGGCLIPWRRARC